MTNDEVAAFWEREEPVTLYRLGQLLDWADDWAATWLAGVALCWAYALAQAYRWVGMVDWSGPLHVERAEPKARTIAAVAGPPVQLGLRETVLFAAVDRPLRVAAHVASWAEIEARATAERIEETANRWLDEVWAEVNCATSSYQVAA
jgi:hypothetical protein